MDKKVNPQTLWLGVGIAIGTSIGVAANQVALGITFGVALGVVVGSVVSKRAGSGLDDMLSEHVKELHKQEEWEEGLCGRRIIRCCC